MMLGAPPAGRMPPARAVAAGDGSGGAAPAAAAAPVDPGPGRRRPQEEGRRPWPVAETPRHGRRMVLGGLPPSAGGAAPPPAEAPPGVCGRTQYKLSDSNGRAVAAMRDFRPASMLASAAVADEPGAASPPRPTAAGPFDCMTKFSHEREASPEGEGAPLVPVHVEGLGRIAVHAGVLGAVDPAAAAQNADKAPAADSRCGPARFRARLGGSNAALLGPGADTAQLPQLDWPDAPDSPWDGTCAAIRRHDEQRQASARRWLSSDEEAATDTPPAAAGSAPERLHHPMVAKLLRDRNRKRCAAVQPGALPSKRARRTPEARELWIGLDGVRAPRSAPRRGVRRIASNMRSLAASGIAPVMACRCGFTDEQMDMVQCDGCQRWLHLACLGVCHVQQLGSEDWLCDDCFELNSALAQGPAALPGTAPPPPFLGGAPAVPYGDVGPPGMLPAFSHAGSLTSTLSLAPSPQRTAVPAVPRAEPAPVPVPVRPPPAWGAEEAATPAGAATAALRSPSPNPFMDMAFMTPSRHARAGSGAGEVRLRSLLPRAAPYASPDVGMDVFSTPSRFASGVPMYATPRAALSTPFDDFWSTPQRDMLAAEMRGLPQGSAPPSAGVLRAGSFGMDPVAAWGAWAPSETPGSLHALTASFGRMPAAGVETPSNKRTPGARTRHVTSDGVTCLPESVASPPPSSPMPALGSSGGRRDETSGGVLSSSPYLPTPSWAESAEADAERARLSRHPDTSLHAGYLMSMRMRNAFTISPHDKPAAAGSSPSPSELRSAPRLLPPLASGMLPDTGAGKPAPAARRRHTRILSDAPGSPTPRGRAAGRDGGPGEMLG